MPHRIRTRPASTGRGSLPYTNLTDSGPEHKLYYFNTVTDIHATDRISRSTTRELDGLADQSILVSLISNIIVDLGRQKPKVLICGCMPCDNLRLADTASDLRGPSEDYRHDAAPRCSARLVCQGVFFSFYLVRGGRDAARNRFQVLVIIFVVVAPSPSRRSRPPRKNRRERASRAQARRTPELSYR